MNEVISNTGDDSALRIKIIHLGAFSVIWPDERKNFKNGEVIKIKEMRK